MRYEKLETILRIALAMQGNAEGLSLADIERDFAVSRRTAERMRDAVLRVFPQAVEAVGDDRIKRWRIEAGTMNRLVAFSADELASLATAARLLERDNMTAQARLVEGVLAKIKPLMRAERLARVEPDLEALIEADGIALRPGPRPKVDADILRSLREAVLACREVTITYRSRGTGRTSRQTVRPYGFLYGSRHYLVAYSPGVIADLGAADGWRLFSLANIEGVASTGQGFARDPGFSLARYARDSFGVYQEKPVGVEWRFAEEVAADARDYLFHPGQKMRDNPDGTLTVTFRAGGLREMAWHLMTWGDMVEVVKPRKLARMVKDMGWEVVGE